MKILCLFVRHGTDHYPDALHSLDEWYDRHGLREKRTLWIIDNARDADQPAEQIAPRTLLRSGDNSAWEFSTWALALQQAAGEGESFDLVHFVTSAFNTLYTEYLKHFHTDMLTYVLQRQVCLGHIDSYLQPITLGAIYSQSWIRTCFFILPWKEAVSLSPWVGFRNRLEFFESEVSRKFRPDAPLSFDYQMNITSWLEGQERGGHTWHSPVRSGDEEDVRFQLKTLAILNEHNLAVTMRAAGISLIDFCWLHALRGDRAWPSVQPPPEQEQLKVRRKILGIPE
ncbi:MAG: hypothetical protein ABI273_09285 [Lacunisphaera sp.]